MKNAFIGVGLLAAGLLIAGIWAWTPDRSRSDLVRKYFDDSTRYIEVAGTQLRLRETGKKTAPAIILLHGFGSSLETWQPWSPLLSGQFRVVRFDLPGSGLSGADRTGNYDDSRSLELVNSLMTELQIDQAVLVGHSLGGRIAWKFAAAYPSRVKKLVLISPDGFASPPFEYGKRAEVPWIMQLIKYFLPKGLLRRNLALAYYDSSRPTTAELDRYYDLLLAPGNRAAMIERMKQTVLNDPNPLLHRITMPTLLLWGEQDRMIPFSNSVDYLRSLPNATLMPLPMLGHLPHEEAPQDSIRPLLQFLMR